MPPDDSRPASPIIPKRPYLRPEAERTRPAVQEAAANVVRSNIESIYQGKAKVSPITPTETQSEVNPYDRTHKANRTSIHEEQWKLYHSAWQDYYRQYYERYYLGEVYRMRQTIETKAKPGNDASNQPMGASSNAAPDADDAMYDLKGKLLGNIGASATKVRKSHHFGPIMAAVVTMLIFIFIETNSFIIANVNAYVSPGYIDPANIIVDPAIDVPVSNEPKLIIPKINVDVPIIYDTKPDQASQLNAMQRGVAWFGIPGANSRPGQVGNTVLSGHSSNDFFDPGDFKFIFARLEQLDIGDTFYLNYEGVRYTYNVTKTEVVKPTDVYKLVYKTDKPVVTLITCVPIGTAQSRLLITAEQISPNPALATSAPVTPAGSSESEAMPGVTSSIINRLLGR